MNLEEELQLREQASFFDDDSVFMQGLQSVQDGISQKFRNSTEEAQAVMTADQGIMQEGSTDDPSGENNFTPIPELDQPPMDTSKAEAPQEGLPEGAEMKDIPYPEVAPSAPQGAVASENTTEMEQVMDSDKTSFKDRVKGVAASMGLISSRPEFEERPSVLDDPGSPFDESYVDIAGTKEYAELQNAFTALEADPNDLVATRKRDELINVFKNSGRFGELNTALGDSAGLIPTTAPYEYALLNTVGIARAGGMAAIKALAPYMPLAILGDVAVEEIASEQDNWAAALATSIVGGVITGHASFNVAPKVARGRYTQFRNYVSTKQRDAFYEALRKAGPATELPPGQRVPKPTKAQTQAKALLDAPEATTEAIQRAVKTRAETAFNEAPPVYVGYDTPPISPATGPALASAVKTVETRNRTQPMPPKFTEKVVQVIAKRIEHKVALGQLDDEATVTVAEEVFSKPIYGENEQAETAKVMSEARAKIAKARESLKSTSETATSILEANPITAADANNPFVVPEVPLKPGDRNALERHVREQWYGVPNEIEDEALRNPFNVKDSKVMKNVDAMWSIHPELSKSTGWATTPGDFAEDFLTQYDLRIKELEGKGESIVGRTKEIQQEVFDRQVQEYEEAIAEDLEYRMSNLDHQGMVAQNNEYILGGETSDDAKFATPQSAESGITFADKRKPWTIPPNPVTEKGHGWDSPSPYYFNDWVIEPQIRRIGQVERMRFKSGQLEPAPEGKVNTAKPALITYPKKETYLGLAQLAGQLRATIGNKKNWVKEPKAKGEDFQRKTLKAADRLKVLAKFYKKVEDRTPGSPDFTMGMALKPEHTDAVARWLGWNEDMIVSVASVSPGNVMMKAPRPVDGVELEPTENPKASYVSTQEDIKYLLDVADETEVLDPGYFERNDAKAALYASESNGPTNFSEAELENLKPPPLYYRMRGARDAYRKQRDAYLRKVLNLPAGKKPPKYKMGFTRQMEVLAVMQDQLAREAKRLRGGPWQTASQRMYLAAGDHIAGTTRYKEAVSMERSMQRKQAMRDLMADSLQPDINTVPFETWENAIQNTMVRENMGFDEAAKYMADRAGTMKLSDWNAYVEDQEYVRAAIQRGLTIEEAEEEVAELRMERERESQELADSMAEMELANMDSSLMDPAAAGRTADIAGAYMSGEVIDPGSAPDQMQIDAAKDARPTLNESTLDTVNLTDAEKLVIGEHVSAMEDVFTARVMDDRYVASGSSSAAKFNPFRINNMGDIDALIEVARTMGKVDSNRKIEAYIGFKPSDTLSREAAPPLARVAYDMDATMRPLAKALVADPDNVVKAIAFEKMRAAQSVFLDILKNGKASSPVKQAFKSTDLHALDDATMLRKLSMIIDDNYAIYGGVADTRRVVETAQMYNSVIGVAPRLKWNSEVAETMKNSGYLESHKKNIRLRKELTKILQEGCA